MCKIYIGFENLIIIIVISIILVEMVCRSGAGQDYAGTVSKTRSDKTCQRWDSQSPHSHDYTDITTFPDDAFSDVNNFCRSPDGDSGGPWCYTTDPDTQWEYCDIPICPGMSVCKIFCSRLVLL